MSLVQQAKRRKPPFRSGGRRHWGGSLSDISSGRTSLADRIQRVRLTMVPGNGGGMMHSHERSDLKTQHGSVLQGLEGRQAAGK